MPQRPLNGLCRCAARQFGLAAQQDAPPGCVEWWSRCAANFGLRIGQGCLSNRGEGRCVIKKEERFSSFSSLYKSRLYTRIHSNRVFRVQTSPRNGPNRAFQCGLDKKTGLDAAFIVQMRFVHNRAYALRRVRISSVQTLISSDSNKPGAAYRDSRKNVISSAIERSTSAPAVPRRNPRRCCSNRAWWKRAGKAWFRKRHAFRGRQTAGSCHSWNRFLSPW